MTTNCKDTTAERKHQHSETGILSRIFVVVIAAISFAAISTNSQAGLTVYSSTLTVTDLGEQFSGGAVESTSISIGDKFVLSFTLDDSVIDSNPSATFANFGNAYSDVSLTRLSSNAGSWNPSFSTYNGENVMTAGYISGNTYNFSFGLNFSGGQSVDYIGFPENGSAPFYGLSFGFSTTSSPSDTGAGQTLASRLPSSATWTINTVNLTFQGGFAEPFVTTESSAFDAAAVPEPSTFALGSLGALAFAAVALRRRQS